MAKHHRSFSQLTISITMASTFLAWACGSDHDESSIASGGVSGSGGLNAGGSPSGGTTAGGTPSVGGSEVVAGGQLTSSGGSSAGGGAKSGGVSNTGGTGAGGVSTGSRPPSTGGTGQSGTGGTQQSGTGGVVGTGGTVQTGGTGGGAQTGGTSGTAGAGSVPVTITADLSTARGELLLSRSLSSTPGQGSTLSTSTWDHIKALGLQRARVWLRAKDFLASSSGTPDYVGAYPYLDSWSKAAPTLYVNWATDYRNKTAAEGWTVANLLAAQIAALTHYKTRYPSITFLECENEPVIDVPGMTNYYVAYRFCYRMVNAVNSRGLPGPAIQVGGPVTSTFSAWGMQRFLDDYAADTAPDKRLDFIAYHQYLFDSASKFDNKDNPARVADERRLLDGYLSARGLPSLPVYVSETGIFQTQVETALGLVVDQHIQAAGMAAMHAFYADQARIEPFNWTIQVPTAMRKSMFVDIHDTPTRPLPFYLLQQMHSLLPRTRYACSTALSPRGIGVGSLAAGSATQVAVMTWNYQWTARTAHTVDHALTKLPAAFRAGSVRVERYLVGADLTYGELPKVEDRNLGPLDAGSYRSRNILEANALHLIILTATP